MDRRQVIAGGGLAAALSGATAARADPAGWTVSGQGHSVLDLGVEANTDRDQTAAMQKAIAAIATGAQPVFIPAGRYRVSSLKLTMKSTVIGVPGLSILYSNPAPALDASNVPGIALRGLTFEGGGVRLQNCDGASIADCDAVRCTGDGIFCSGSAFSVSNVRTVSCAASGIRVEGDGIVSGNIVSGGGKFGLRIGGKDKLGNISATNNLIRGTDCGIAVSNANGGYVLISMNMISGAKNGGIRVLNGDTPIGTDQSRSFDSDAYRNLAIVANISV